RKIEKKREGPLNERLLNGRFTTKQAKRCIPPPSPYGYQPGTVGIYGVFHAHGDRSPRKPAKPGSGFPQTEGSLGFRRLHDRGEPEPKILQRRHFQQRSPRDSLFPE